MLPTLMATRSGPFGASWRTTSLDIFVISNPSAQGIGRKVALQPSERTYLARAAPRQKIITISKDHSRSAGGTLYGLVELTAIGVE
jgi:hypothetical protein